MKHYATFATTLLVATTLLSLAPSAAAETCVAKSDLCVDASPNAVWICGIYEECYGICEISVNRAEYVVDIGVWDNDYQTCFHTAIVTCSDGDNVVELRADDEDYPTQQNDPCQHQPHRVTSCAIAHSGTGVVLEAHDPESSQYVCVEPRPCPDGSAFYSVAHTSWDLLPNNLPASTSEVGCTDYPGTDCGPIAPGPNTRVGYGVCVYVPWVDVEPMDGLCLARVTIYTNGSPAFTSCI